MSFILEAAKEFKRIATSLTNELCILANVKIDDPDRNVRFRELFGKQKEHPLNANWIFCLHGAECRFTHNFTEQVLEVIMTNGEEMGVLDPYFLYKFCESTDSFRQIAFVYKDNLEELESDLIDLFQKGELRKVENGERSLRRALTT